MLVALAMLGNAAGNPEWTHVNTFASLGYQKRNLSHALTDLCDGGVMHAHKVGNTVRYEFVQAVPVRALLAQADKLAVGSRIEEAPLGTNFITKMNSLPLHEQDAVIAKLRAKQIRVGASDTCKSLLAEIRGAHQVVAANGKEKWLKGMKWACYEKNAPNPGYLQGVNERYKTLPRYEQTAVWQHLNA